MTFGKNIQIPACADRNFYNSIADAWKIKMWYALILKKVLSLWKIKRIMARTDTYIRFDWAIKHILRDKTNYGILEGLISVLLNEKITIKEILESEANQDNEQDKFNRVDIKAENSNGHLIIVEVQLTRQLYYLQRILYGTCKAITEHINIGDKYDQVRKVYSISILYCDYGHGDDYVYHGETRFKGLHTGNELMVNVKEEGVIVPRLPKTVFPEYYLVRVNAYSKIPENPLDEWIEYLKTGIVKDDTSAPGLQQVKEKLRVMSMSPKEKAAYDAHMDNIMVQNDVLDTARQEGVEEGIEKGVEIGRAEGLEEGMAKKAVQVARNAKSMGMSIEQISALTNLPIEAIEKL